MTGRADLVQLERALASATELCLQRKRAGLASDMTPAPGNSAHASVANNCARAVPEMLVGVVAECVQRFSAAAAAAAS
jgi:hypothetical protein